MATDKMLKEKQAAELLGVSPNTLRTWRSRPAQNPSAPRPSKIGRCIRYSENELRRYIERSTK